MQWLNVILQGVLIGGLYAMFAAGLSLIFGVMRLVNIAHGDLIVLAAYVALMANPRLLLCDEISLGLAPIVVRDIYARLPDIVREGLSLIVVEQDIAQALKAAAQVYCLQEGRIALQGPARELTRESISAAYFGV